MNYVGNGMISSIHNYKRRESSGGLSDICDGSVYQDLVAQGFLASRENISLQFNTDGIPVFKSSSFSFWPLHIIINELPHRMRWEVTLDS